MTHGPTGVVQHGITRISCIRCCYCSHDMKTGSVLIFFVTAPSWKIFSLFVLPLVSLVVVPPTSTSIYVSRSLLLTGVWTDLLWIYSIGVLLYEKYSTYLNIPMLRFKICMIYEFLFSVLFLSDIIPLNLSVPFHLIYFVCNIYALYFISKLIVLIERRAQVKFRDYIGTFVYAWLWVIGVWSIQTRVKKLYLSRDV